MTGPTRTRREPPRLRKLRVNRIEPLTGYLWRVVLAGEELDGFPEPEPAASVRLLVPSQGTEELVIPEWDGNEFLLPNGERPLIRTFTPRRWDPEARELDLDIVLHAGGGTSAWVQAAGHGDPAAVSGPGRGYRIDPTATDFLLAGDETAIPAIGQLLEEIADHVRVRVIVEVGHPDARFHFPPHPGATVEWVERSERPGSALIPAVTGASITSGTQVWVAGEAGSLVPIRAHFSDTLGLDRADVTVRGYWKGGR